MSDNEDGVLLGIDESIRIRYVQVHFGNKMITLHYDIEKEWFQSMFIESIGNYSSFTNHVIEIGTNVIYGSWMENNS